LALKEAGRKLGRYLRKREHAKREERRRGIFEMYIGELVQSLGKLTPINRRELQKQLVGMATAQTRNGAADIDEVAAIAPSHAEQVVPEEEEGAP